MTIHDFTSRPKKNQSGVVPERGPSINTEIYRPDVVEDANEDIHDLTNRNVEDVASVLQLGFRALDEGVKAWLSDVKVPSGNSIKPVNLRIAGGDKTFLVWRQDLRSGRISLPAISINRGSFRFNEEKFSPPYIPMRKSLTNRTGSHVKLTYRPWPALVDYQLSLWTEWKDDAELITYQIVTRMNPLAEIVIQDDRLIGNVQIRFNDVTDNSDVDVGAEDLPKVRYDIGITAEAWLPLSEKVVPTVLGKVATANEFTGSFLEVLGIKNTSVAGGGFTKQPETK